MPEKTFNCFEFELIICSMNKFLFEQNIDSTSAHSPNPYEEFIVTGRLQPAVFFLERGTWRENPGKRLIKKNYTNSKIVSKINY